MGGEGAGAGVCGHAGGWVQRRRRQERATTQWLFSCLGIDHYIVISSCVVQTHSLSGSINRGGRVRLQRLSEQGAAAGVEIRGWR